MKATRPLILAALVAAGLLSMSGCATTSQNKETDISTLMETRKGYVEAVSTADVELYVSLWDENAVRMAPNAPAIVGREAIGAMIAKQFPLFTREMETFVDELIYAGDYIIIRGHYTVKMTPKSGGTPILVDGKNLTVWKRQNDGSWRAYIDCFNSNTP